MKYSNITPNNIVDAVKIINDLHESLNSRYAINFLLYGSTLRNGLGNDIDICVVHCFRDPTVIIKAVVDWFEYREYKHFGTLTTTGALFRKVVDGFEQTIDVWFVFNDPARVMKEIIQPQKIQTL